MFTHKGICCLRAGNCHRRPFTGLGRRQRRRLAGLRGALRGGGAGRRKARHRRDENEGREAGCAREWWLAAQTEPKRLRNARFPLTHIHVARRASQHTSHTRIVVENLGYWTHKHLLIPEPILTRLLHIRLPGEAGARLPVSGIGSVWHRHRRKMKSTPAWNRSRLRSCFGSGTLR